MSTAKQAFRLGFLQKCADAGMTAEQATELATRAVAIVKQAQQEKRSAGELIGAARGGLNALGSLAGSAAGYIIPAALIAPPVIGSIAGHYAAQASDVDDETIKSIHKKELIEEIRRNRQILEQKRRTYR